MRRACAWGFSFFPMPKKLKRYYGRGDLHFLTFSCYRRLLLLGRVQARNVFVRALEEMRERHRFLLVGYVVMPDHVHLLISEPAKGTPVHAAASVEAARIARDLRERRRRTPAGELRLAFSRGGGDLPRFWQPGFHHFNVHSAKKRREKLEYMHANPVKRGLVGNPAHWIWSSYLSYEKNEMGLVRIDFVD